MNHPQWTLKRRFLKFLTLLSGNTFVQRVLDKNLEVTRFLVGIDSGTWAESSGEFIAVKKAIASSNEPHCIFDIGANEGQFIRVVEENIPQDKEYVIHSFEPSKYTCSFLREKLDGNERVVLNNVGLSAEPGELTLFYDEPGSGRASLTKRDLGYMNVDFSQSEKVQIETVDRYCTENSINRIDLLKIDVEGHELDVLHGATEMLSKGNIGMVCFEFSSCNVDTRIFMRDFFLFFEEYGMEIYRITASGFLKGLGGYRDVYEMFGDSNYIAMRK